MHKGHKHFKTVVGDIEQGYLLDVLNTHKQSEVIEALMQQPSHLREQVEQVSIDINLANKNTASRQRGILTGTRDLLIRLAVFLKAALVCGADSPK